MNYDLKGHGWSNKTHLAKFFLTETFIYQSILMKISVNANIMKTQF
jgi:hypothetical protein